MAAIELHITLFVTIRRVSLGVICGGESQATFPMVNITRSLLIVALPVRSPWGWTRRRQDRCDVPRHKTVRRTGNGARDRGYDS